MGLVTLFNGSSGLNTKVDATRVPFNSDAGISDLSVAINIVHDDSGRIGRRSGYSSLYSGGFHSLYSNGQECYVCENEDLYQVAADLSIVGVRSGMSGDRVDYASTPLGIYYVNGTDVGVLRDGASFLWPIGTYIGPETTRYFTTPPAGNHIEFFESRLFIAEDKTLWWTEPNNYGLIDQSRNFVMFKSRIRMIKAVDTGLFVSTDELTYFLAGKVPMEFTRKTVAEYPALEWSDCPHLVEAQDIGLEGAEQFAIWGSPEGVVLGSPQGGIINLTESKVRVPAGFVAGATLVADDNIISTLYY